MHSKMVVVLCSIEETIFSGGKSSDKSFRVIMN